MIETAVEAAWSTINAEDLRDRTRRHDVSFPRQLAISALHDEFGMRQEEACRMFGRSPSYYAKTRSMLTKRLESSEVHRKQATRFFEELDAEKRRYCALLAS